MGSEKVLGKARALATYLEPHKDKIIHMSARGQPPDAIAQALYDAGLRSPHRREYWSPAGEAKAITAMVRYILRGGYRPKKPKVKWQEWTPEKQYAEMQTENYI